MKKSLNQIYGSPLPLKVRPLPPIIPHNPLSWAYWLYEYWFPRPEEKISCIGTLSVSSSSEDALYVRVDDLKDIDRLWSMGFFGKGTLSRSEPSWYIRSARRLGLDGGEKLTSEDYTAARREERKKFKLERAKAEAEELERRKMLDKEKEEKKEGVNENETEKENNIGNELVPISSDQINSSAKSSPESTHQSTPQSSVTTETSSSTPPSSSPPPPLIRLEDEGIIDSDNKLIQQEFLQLMPQEAFFLSYALGVLQVVDPSGNTLSPEQLLRRFVSQNPRFISDYVVYHHYRSLGWCVRSGVKFGSELLLYKRGPPFSHAEFAIRILLSPCDEQHDWWWNTSIGRVIGGVKKTLVFCYVQGDNCKNAEYVLDENNSLNIKKILESYKIREVVYRRWIATRNRD